METCAYKKVANYTIETKEKCRKSFLRQLLVSSVVWSCFFIGGLCVGSPTVVIPQIRREANSTDAVSYTMASWLSAMFGYASVPWAMIMLILAEYFGRKIPLFIICFITFVAFIVFYLSNTVLQLLISEVLESITGAAISTVLTMLVTEYTSPKYRGFFLTFKSATMFWGIWVSNAIGTFFHWKYIGIIKLICLVYPSIVVFLIPESPYWLASKGKFEKCAKSHRWLKGEHSEMELERLISLQRDYIFTNKSRPFSLLRICNIILTKEFYKPTLLSMLLFALYYLSGKLACTMYSLDIIKKITTSEKAAYVGMLILNGVTVFSMYLGTVLCKYLQRRTLLLVCSSIGTSFLFILSFYTYLIKESYIVENHVLTLFLLMCYSIAIACGPLVLATSVSAELISLKYRTLSFWIISSFERFVMGVTIQILPFIVRNFGLEFGFFFFGLSSIICIILLYHYLPETKDKTLQDINDTILGVQRQTKLEVTYN